MTSILDRKASISGIDYFFIFMLLFYAGGASYFARSIGNILTVGNAIILSFTVFVQLHNRIKFGNEFLISCIIFLIYAAITSFLNMMVNPLWISQWLIWFYITYICCKYYKKRFFVVFETVMFWMTAIAMLFWIVELIAPESLESFIRSISFLESYSPEVNNANIVFYTIQDATFIESEPSIIARNPGFAWEPGAFSVFLCFALFCNLIRTGWRLSNNIALFLFVLALFSTQSTTGICILFVCILMKLVLDKKILAALIFSVPLAVIFSTLPFLLPKLQSQIIDINNFTYEDLSGGTQYLGRLRSLYLAIQDFKLHPIFGLGGYSEGTVLKRMGFEDVSLISGIGELLSKYGIVMTALFVFSFVYSAVLITKQFRCYYGYILIPIFIGSCVSYSLWRNPIIMVFWMYCYYNTFKVKQFMPPMANIIPDEKI